MGCAEIILLQGQNNMDELREDILQYFKTFGANVTGETEGRSNGQH
jgi:hypothetical protein